MSHTRFIRVIIYSIGGLAVLLSAASCISQTPGVGNSGATDPLLTRVVAATDPSNSTVTSQPGSTILTPTGTATLPPTGTPTLFPTDTSTPEPATTSTLTCNGNLRGVLIPEKTACRYGPGAMYLYLYGLNQGAVQNIIGRNDLGTWLLTRAGGDATSCWVKTDLMKINGELNCLPSIQPDDFHLPLSSIYGPLSGVSASRNGNKVMINWDALVLDPGNDSLQTPYVVEAWVCRDGKFFFDPAGSYNPYVTIEDESGCSEPSHGRVMAAEKHGYTRWVEIPWPLP